MNLVLFDFDGTITTKDTLFDFIRYAVGTQVFILKLFLIAPVLLLYVIKCIPNWKAKQIVLRQYFGGWDYQSFSVCAKRYATERLPHLIRDIALNTIHSHIINNDKVVIVSASVEEWIKPWCQNYGIETIATRLEVVDGKLTGNFKDKNCYGKEKVLQVKRHYDLNAFSTIYAYGDSKGDREILGLADIAFYKWKRVK